MVVLQELHHLPLTFALGCSSLVYIVITIFTLYNMKSMYNTNVLSRLVFVLVSYMLIDAPIVMYGLRLLKSYFVYHKGAIAPLYIGMAQVGQHRSHTFGKSTFPWQ